MAPRTLRKKNTPILSHEFVRKNYGDIVCIAFLILFGGSMLKHTSKYTIPLVRFSYLSPDSINSTTDNEPLLYENGVWDLAPIFSYSLLCTVITCLVNENICDRYIPRLQFSQKKAWQLRYIITNSCFYVFTLLINAAIWKGPLSDESFSLKTHMVTLLNSYPQIYVPIYVKIFYTIAMSFCVCMMMNLYFLNVKSKFYMDIISHNVIIFLICYLMQHYNCGIIGVYLITCYTIPRLVWSIKYMVQSFNPKKSEYLHLALSIIHFIVSLVGVIVSTSIICYMFKIEVTITPKKLMYVVCVVFSNMVSVYNLMETLSVLFKSNKKLIMSAATPQKSTTKKTTKHKDSNKKSSSLKLDKSLTNNGKKRQLNTSKKQ